ncbi:MAG: class I SAM-dependent methyltransferase [Anaerolineae bacterium]|nr:class I SAM-dependent methyltransferase [Anaerolineae bacterium]
MAIDRSRRITFEEVAELYNEVRPGYPEALIDDVLALSRIPTDGRILEIGCGPGTATVSFARRGYRITGIELGERLAALAVKNCRAYPGVEIHHVAFEEWVIEEKGFDLAISADAFHWIPPEIGYPKVARALKDPGSAAFFWFVPVDPQTDWSQAIEEVYRERAPGVENPDKSFTAEWVIEIIQENLAASGCFGDVTVKQYTWSEIYTSDRYVKSLRTFSGHRGLDEETRDRLFAGIHDVIERFGGTVIQPRHVVLFHARVRQ